MDKNNSTTPKHTASTAGTPVVPVMANDDVEKNKVWAIVAYLGILGVLIVLLTEAKNSPFAKFHLNQSLPIAIAGLIGSAVLGMIPFVGWALLPILSIGVLVLMIMGIINAAQGEAKKLPIVGNFDLIK